MASRSSRAGGFLGHLGDVVSLKQPLLLTLTDPCSYSILYLPIADATAITYLSPSLACYACAILLKEPFTRKEQLAGLISLCGVVLIARPTTLFAASSDGAAGLSGDGGTTNSTAPAISDASSYADITTIQRLTAVGVALLGVVGSAAVYTVLRWIGKRAHPLITVNYFAAWCTIVSTVAMSVLPEVGWLFPADLKEWGYLLFLGVCGFIMVGAVTWSDHSRR